MDIKEIVGKQGPLSAEQKQKLAVATAVALGISPDNVFYLSGERVGYQAGSMFSGIQKIQVKIRDNATGQTYDHEFTLDFGLGGDVERPKTTFVLPLSNIFKVLILLSGVYLAVKFALFKYWLIALGIYFVGWLISYVTAPKDIPVKRLWAWPAVWATSLIFCRRFPWQK